MGFKHYPLRLLLTLWFYLLPLLSTAAPMLLGATCINSQGTAIASIPLQGGKFVCQSVLNITHANQYVIDFKNTSTIARFQHELVDSHDNRIVIKGGLNSPEHNPFMLRHGRVVSLQPGTYRLITWLQSPYYLAHPEVYVTDLKRYQKRTHFSTAIGVLMLGVLLGLFIYFAAIGMVKGHMAERMYALFILGNLIFHATALGVFNQFFDQYWFYLTGAPLLIANLAYISFICHLLGITQAGRPNLYQLSLFTGGILLAALVLGMIFPSWMLEMSRYGVAISLCFGLICGVRLGWKKQQIACLYLLAITVCLLFGWVAIHTEQLWLYPLTTEQVGLLAVSIETILLSLLMAHKTSRLYHEKEVMLIELQNTRSLALTDRLTGIPNRHALENKLLQLPPHHSLIFLDMDNLKYINDHFGHETGDHLLKLFSRTLAGKLLHHGQLYRLGGDEFAILCHEDNVEWCQHQLEYTHLQLEKEGFTGVGASIGVVFTHEAKDTAELLRIADKRMYIDKRTRKNRKEMMQVLHPQKTQENLSPS
ncbi:diguanylate cyclase (GGDEF) domain-containing protein [Methylophilus rhizosphaerae]|uniref:diguanylate cyclase n=1 Tax=Methylophilus rhizosphaerae TaxID=492660 RepID=A0A1G9B6S8_9PROT|nr:diguanylate cyclase [Methylophilus rhizosphaerae]SDK35231.1 diguanylate cyclase (GGDEF) domain-containing protein [Methylophilus rhizosphaerae]